MTDLCRIPSCSRTTRSGNTVPTARRDRDQVGDNRFADRTWPSTSDWLRTRRSQGTLHRGERRSHRLACRSPGHPSTTNCSRKHARRNAHRRRNRRASLRRNTGRWGTSSGPPRSACFRSPGPERCSRMRAHHSVSRRGSRRGARRHNTRCHRSRLARRRDKPRTRRARKRRGGHRSTTEARVERPNGRGAWSIETAR